jgi:hypothetical protein
MTLSWNDSRSYLNPEDFFGQGLDSLNSGLSEISNQLNINRWTNTWMQVANFQLMQSQLTANQKQNELESRITRLSDVCNKYKDTLQEMLGVITRSSESIREHLDVIKVVWDEIAAMGEEKRATPYVAIPGSYIDKKYSIIFNQIKPFWDFLLNEVIKLEQIDSEFIDNPTLEGVLKRGSFYQVSFESLRKLDELEAIKSLEKLNSFFVSIVHVSTYVRVGKILFDQMIKVQDAFDEYERINKIARESGFLHDLDYLISPSEDKLLERVNTHSLLFEFFLPNEKIDNIDEKASKKWIDQLKSNASAHTLLAEKVLLEVENSKKALEISWANFKK